MALPALLGAGAKAVGSSLAKGAASKAFGGGKKGAAKNALAPRKDEGGGGKGGDIAPMQVQSRPTTSAIVPFAPVGATKTVSASGSAEGVEGKVERIKVSVLNIESYFKTKIKAKKSSLQKQAVSKEREKGNLKEQERETNKETKSKAVKDNVFAKPKSFLDMILGGITKILMGALLMRLLPHLPKLQGFLTAALEVGKFVLDWVGKILDGLVTFLSWGVDAYDATMGWIGDTFGEDALNAVEKVSGALINLINAAVIVGSAMMAMDMNPFGGGKNDPLQKLQNKAAGKLGARFLKTAAGKAVTKMSGGVIKHSASRSVGRLGLKLFGKAGLKAVKGIFGRIPIIGPLIVGVSSLLAGEGIGKALFKAFGAALGGFLGSFIPIPVLGTILGEMVGTYVGDLVHTLIMGGGMKALGERLKKDIAAALNIAGAAFNFLKDGAVRFFENFPTVDVPDIRPGKIFADIMSINPLYKAMMEFEVKLPKGPLGSIHKALDMIPLMPKEWKTALKEGFSLRGIFDSLPGVQEILGKFASFIPGMDKYVKNGKLTKIPNLLLLTPPGLPFLLPHVGKSFLPDIFKGKKKAPTTPKESPPDDQQSGEGFFEKAGGAMSSMMSGVGNMFGAGGGGGGGGPMTATVTKLGSGGGSLKDMTDQDWSDLAYIVSGEAARGTDDEYGVAAAVLNRVSDPKWPNSIMGVGTQAGQFEAVYTGKARREPALANKLKANQSKIVEALKTLNGRTDFKGQSMLKYKGSTDPMFHPRGNFYHYTSQRGKNDPVPANPPQHWKKLLGPSTGVEFARDTTTSDVSLQAPAAAPASSPMQFTPAPAVAPAAGDTDSGGGGGGTAAAGGGSLSAGGFTPAPSRAAGQKAESISQMTQYEKSAAGMLSTPSFMIPKASRGGPPGVPGAPSGGGGGATPLNKRAVVDTFFKAQLLGFLQQQ